MDQDKKGTKWLGAAGAVLLILLVIAGLIFVLSRQGTGEDLSSADNQAGSGVSIYAQIKANANLSTLGSAVDAAELKDALSEPSVSVTVFAPSNKGFADIQSSVDTLLLPENLDKLIDVLNYHIVEGRYRSADLKDGMLLSTLQGKELMVRVEGDNFYVEDALITSANNMASNGVLHIIDAVVLP